MHRFYSTDFDSLSNQAFLDETETRHLRDVLRIRVGDSVNVFDGIGNEHTGRVEQISRHSTVLSALRSCPPASPESNFDLTLAVALTKGDKFELVIQKAVELGVNRITPILTERCDVRPGGGEKRLVRWTRIAIDATKQCGRARLITIDPVTEFDTFLENSSNETATVLFSERGGRKFESIDVEASIRAVIGPEGGWEQHELDQAERHGFSIITLGGRILRAETAAIAIAAILQHRFGDLS
jgi:16S rRNA (uracil1498-N3)-methyltransferase